MPMAFAGPSSRPAPISSPSGDDLWRVGASPITVGPALPDLSTMKPQAGFFHHGGLGEKILSGVGDFATRMAASLGDPAAASALQNRDLDRRAAQAARLQAMQDVWKRNADWNTWERQQQWKLQHPDDQFTQYIQAAGIDPTSPQGQALYRQRAESMAAPPLTAVDGFDAQGNHTKTFYPRSALGIGATQPSPQSGPPVGFVRNGYRFLGGNYRDRNSWVPVGGASSSGGATFR